MTIGVLAVQGDFEEHKAAFERLGASAKEIRCLADLTDDLDRLVLPGGESTTQSKLLHELGLFLPLRERILAGMPVLATCAGLILLAQQVEGTAERQFPGFATLPVRVRRNAYGRQLGSFTAPGFYNGQPIPAFSFIRAPKIVQLLDSSLPSEAASTFSLPVTPIQGEPGTATSPVSPTFPVCNDVDHGLRPIAHLDDSERTIVGVQFGKQIGLAFHPEIDQDLTVARHFCSL